MITRYALDRVVFVFVIVDVGHTRCSAGALQAFQIES